MIEVGQDGCGYWAWTLISASGRTLCYGEGYLTRYDAWLAAWLLRRDCWARADAIDHRMGACR